MHCGRNRRRTTVGEARVTESRAGFTARYVRVWPLPGLGPHRDRLFHEHFAHWTLSTAASCRTGRFRVLTQAWRVDPSKSSRWQPWPTRPWSFGWKLRTRALAGSQRVTESRDLEV